MIFPLIRYPPNLVEMQFKKKKTHHMVEQLLWGFWSHHVVGIQPADFYDVVLILFTAKLSPGE